MHWPLLAIFLTPVTAHSWNEQLTVIHEGKFVGQNGYSRGYVSRSDPGYTDSLMTYLLPPTSSGRLRINEEDLLCAQSQRNSYQTEGYPRLEVSPGSYIAIKYLENGHVTLPEAQPGKPPERGQVHVFGTERPDAQERLTKVLEWTPDASGGDRRGKLLTVQNFDDGRCYQINDGTISRARQKAYPNPIPENLDSVNEQWCETDVLIPGDLRVGTQYTIYWVWQWPTSPGAPGLPEGKDEFYTTCSDIDIISDVVHDSPTNPLRGQDPQTAAVANFRERANRIPL